jgi:hypothetical protein
MVAGATPGRPPRPQPPDAEAGIRAAELYANEAAIDHFDTALALGHGDAAALLQTPRRPACWTIPASCLRSRMVSSTTAWAR